MINSNSIIFNNNSNDYESSKKYYGSNEINLIIYNYVNRFVMNDDTSKRYKFIMINKNSTCKNKNRSESSENSDQNI